MESLTINVDADAAVGGSSLSEAVHDDLMKGGTLVLQMGAEPSDWGK